MIGLPMWALRLVSSPLIHRIIINCLFAAVAIDYNSESFVYFGISYILGCTIDPLKPMEFKPDTSLVVLARVRAFSEDFRIASVAVSSKIDLVRLAAISEAVIHAACWKRPHILRDVTAGILPDEKSNMSTPPPGHTPVTGRPRMNCIVDSFNRILERPVISGIPNPSAFDIARFRNTAAQVFCASHISKVARLSHSLAPALVCHLCHLLRLWRGPNFGRGGLMKRLS
jgi:hypothetical protein